MGLRPVVLAMALLLAASGGPLPASAVAADAPTAVLTVVPASPTCRQEVVLDGSGSTGSGARLVRYRWTPGDGSGPVETAEPTLRHVFPGLGRYDAGLVVVDELGQQSAPATVRVLTTPRAPTAVLDLPAELASGSAVSARADRSSDPDAPCGDRVSGYEWRVDDGAPVVTADPSLALGRLADGPHTVRLVVVDTAGLRSAAATAVVRVRPVPTAVLDVRPSAPVCGQAVEYDGSQSTAAGGRLVRWTFDLGDGAGQIASAEPVLERPVSSLAARDVALQVVDDLGQTSALARTRIVPAPRAPTAVLDLPATAAAGTAVTALGNRSSDPDTPCGDRVVRWSWRVDGGPPTVTADDRLPLGALSVGRHQVTLVVTDTSGVDSPATTATVTVLPLVGVADVTGREGAPTVAVPVRLSSAAPHPVTVHWRTADGTAVAGRDYTAASGKAEIPAGGTTVTLPVALVDDRTSEPAETVRILLDAADGAVLARSAAVVRIEDDDDTAPPVLSAVKDVVVETKLSAVQVLYPTPTASDAVDGTVPVECVSRSGSTFPQGTSTVTCTAKDRSGNAASTRFSVLVRQPTTSGAVTNPGNDRPLEVVAPGRRVRVTAGGFAAGTPVALVWLGPSGRVSPLATARAGADGRFDVRPKVPSDAAGGPAQVTAIGTGPGARPLLRAWRVTVRR